MNIKSRLYFFRIINVSALWRTTRLQRGDISEAIAELRVRHALFCAGRKLADCLERPQRARATYIHFPSTSGEVKEEWHFQLTKCFQVFSKPFSRELFQGILVALGSFFHFTFLIEGKHVRVRHCADLRAAAACQPQQNNLLIKWVFRVVKVLWLHRSPPFQKEQLEHLIKGRISETEIHPARTTLPNSHRVPKFFMTVENSRSLVATEINLELSLLSWI